MDRSELKQALLKGGVYLALRQFVTIALSLISVLVITRILGPEHYGWVIISISCNRFVSSLASMGMKVYLIRKPGDCSERLQGEVLTVLMANSALLTLLAIVTAPLIASWARVPELSLILMAMAPSILLDVCAEVPLGLLERNLRYQRTSMSEIGSLLTYYILAIPLVCLGWDVWGTVVAYLVSSVFKTSTTFIFNPVRPALPRDLKALRDAFASGLSFSSAMWVSQGRGLLVPLLIGRFVGAEAVGLVGATTRIADMLSVVKTVAWQLGMSGFAKLQEDAPAMLRALSKAMTYQSLLLMPVLGLFACLSPVLVPMVLGQKWQHVSDIFPFVALIFLMKVIFDLHTLVLFSTGHNLDVLKFNFVSTLVVCTGISVFGASLHTWGYIVAEMICLSVYFLLHWNVKRLIGSPDYRPFFHILAFTLVPLLFGDRLSPFLSLPIFIFCFGIACLTSAALRSAVSELVTLFRRKARV